MRPYPVYNHCLAPRFAYCLTWPKTFLVSLVFVLFTLLPARYYIAHAADHTETQKSLIAHMEPPNWWVGFQDRTLQIMVHGKQISAYEVKIEKGKKRAQLTGTRKTNNPNYLFLDLELSQKARPGTITLGFYKQNRRVITRNYSLLPRQHGSATRRGFDNSDLIYLITPDRFANGDPSNDNLDNYEDKLNRGDDYGRHGGDLAGVEEHLSYLQKMGFTQIWFNPLLENAMAESSYHGYAATDLYTIDPRFGSNAQMQQLSKKAEKAGIGLIWDAVPNHIGGNHWWMADMPDKNWINHDGKFVVTTHQRTAMQSPYSSDLDREGFASGWFVSAMPDLNQRHPLLAQYLVQNTIWWIEYAGLSGLRIDTYAYSDLSFMGQWLDRIYLEYPNFNTTGEEWVTNPKIVANWQRGRNHSPDGAPLSRSMMDFPLQDALRKGLIEEDGWGTGLMGLYDMLVNDTLYSNPMGLTIFTTNHDMDRTHTQTGKDVALTQMAYVYLLTMRGIPQFYYGDEVLLANEKTHDHGQIREEFPGGWADHDRNGFTGKGLGKEQRETQELVRKLANWRQGATAVQTGKLTHFAPMLMGPATSPLRHLYVYFRYDDAQKIMVVMNKNEQAVDLDLSLYAQMLQGHTSATNILDGTSKLLENGINVSARSASVFEIK